MAYKDITEARAYGRKHYRDNASLYKKRARAHNKRTRDALRIFIERYLRSHSCLDCGEADIVVLEFDHRDPAQKRFDIGHACRRGYSVETVKREIAKCDVRCANCHRRKTHRERLANGNPSRGRSLQDDLFIAD